MRWHSRVSDAGPTDPEMDTPEDGRTFTSGVGVKGNRATEDVNEQAPLADARLEAGSPVMSAAEETQLGPAPDLVPLLTTMPWGSRTKNRRTPHGSWVSGWMIS